MHLNKSNTVLMISYFRAIFAMYLIKYEIPANFCVAAHEQQHRGAVLANKIQANENQLVQFSLLFYATRWQKKGKDKRT